MKIFHLVRSEDVSGVSGTGIVAEGVIFDNGKVALSWKGDTSSVNLYETLQDLKLVHGHEGKTKVKVIGEIHTLK